MLSITRAMSRLLSILLVVVLVTPSVFARCEPIDGVATQGMDCCHKTERAGASLDADCCAMVPDVPGPVQPTTPATSTQSIDRSTAVADSVAPVPPAQPSPVLLVAAFNTSPPGPLYIRFSTIRC